MNLYILDRTPLKALGRLSEPPSSGDIVVFLRHGQDPDGAQAKHLAGEGIRTVWGENLLGREDSLETDRLGMEFLNRWYWENGTDVTRTGEVSFGKLLDWEIGRLVNPAFVVRTGEIIRLALREFPEAETVYCDLADGEGMDRVRPRFRPLSRLAEHVVTSQGRVFRRLESVDPYGRQWKTIGPERAIGCVVYPASEIVEPGVIKHTYGNKFTLGEPDGEISERCRRLSEALEAADLRAPVRDNIRDDIWIKLWGNLCFNPISALTRATLDIVATDPATRILARAMMMEAQAIGENLGVHFRVDIHRRINGAADVGAHKTSMLQDLERGRPMEIDALVTAVQEMGRLTGVPTPNIDNVLGLVQQLATQAGLYPTFTEPEALSRDEGHHLVD